MNSLFAVTLSLALFASSFSATAANVAQVNQKFRSGISGRITDRNGAVVVGATITTVARSSAAGASCKSNDEGAYAIDLEPDTYDVSVAAQGFKKSTRTSIYVGHESRPYVDFVLEVAPPVNAPIIK